MSPPAHPLEFRVPPVAVWAACAALAFVLSLVAPQLAQPVSTIHHVAAGMCVASAGILGLSGIHAFRRAGTTIHPQHADATSRLVVEGIYGFSRNPMYLALAMLLSAVVALLANPVGLIAIVAFVGYIGRFQIAPEERILKAKFGANFDTYCRHVRRWL